MLGFGAGLIKFAGPHYRESQLDDGTIVADVRLQLDARQVPWNQHWNPQQGKWWNLLQPDGSLTFPTADMSGLLA